MATRKKITSRRKTSKPGASKTPAKRKRRVSGTSSTVTMPPTVMVSGIGRYKKSTCHKTKTDAKKAAEGKRNKGVKARVLKSGTGYCVYTRGRAASSR